MKIWIGIVTGLVLLTSCSGPSAEVEATKNSKIVELKKEIMASHDVAMAEMTTLSKLRKELKAGWGAQADTIAYYSVYTELQKASDGMMGWMHGFENVDDKDWTEAEKEAYLEEQLILVNNIEDVTLDIIKRAERVLGK